jgi:hypothetical protein
VAPESHMQNPLFAAEFSVESELTIADARNFSPWPTQNVFWLVNSLNNPQEIRKANIPAILTANFL